MTIPEYAALMQPILSVLAETDGTVNHAQLATALAEKLGLSREAVARRLGNGDRSLLEHRVDWALSYLQRAALVEIEPDGIRLSDGAAAGQAGAKSGAAAPSAPALAEPDQTPYAVDPRTPEEQIASICEGLETKLKRDLLARVHACPPASFERLVIDLLVALGYGRENADLARQVGRTGDGGIDGVIRQDRLGLDNVLMQAKRLRPDTSVPVSAVRDFVGALDARKCNKGVFAATGRFTDAAFDFIAQSSKNVVLIGGDDLVDLMIRNGVGVTNRATYEIKWIDQAYFQR